MKSFSAGESRRSLRAHDERQGALPSRSQHGAVEAEATAKNRYDVVILGAGHNGLAAATYVERAVLSVLLLEKNLRLTPLR